MGWKQSIQIPIFIFMYFFLYWNLSNIIVKFTQQSSSLAAHKNNSFGLLLRLTCSFFFFYICFGRILYKYKFLHLYINLFVFFHFFKSPLKLIWRVRLSRSERMTKNLILGRTDEISIKHNNNCTHVTNWLRTWPPK